MNFPSSPAINDTYSYGGKTWKWTGSAWALQAAALSAGDITEGILDPSHLPAFTGDITTSQGSSATTLATVNANVGTWGSATESAILTVNAKGLITAVSTANVTPAFASITNKPTTLSGYGITDALLATAYTANDVLAKLLTVDGAASLLDADRLDGQEGAYYQNATNLTAGVVPDARLTGSYTNLANLTMSGTLTAITDIRVGHSNDAGRIYHTSNTALNSYGFTTQHGNGLLLINEQGTTNQAMLLGDVDSGNNSTLFGISIGTSAATPSVGSGAETWTPRLTLSGSGNLTVTGTVTGTSFIGNTAWASVSGKPTTLSGYGITDAVESANFTFANLGGKPTTLSGYGITDAVASANFTFANLGGKPTTLSGYGITDALSSTGNQTINGSLNANGSLYANGTLYANGGVNLSQVGAGMEINVRYEATDSTTRRLNMVSNSGARIAVKEDTDGDLRLEVYNLNGVVSNGVVSGNTFIFSSDGNLYKDSAKTIPFWNTSNFDPTTKASLSGATFTGAVITPASATGGSGFRLPHGSAPSSPVDGDVWTTGSGFFWRENGNTKQALPYAGWAATSVIGRSAGTSGTAAAIAASSDGQVLQRVGGALAFATLDFSTLSSKPTTLSGYGISDAQPLDPGLTSLAGLTGAGIITATATDAFVMRGIGTSSSTDIPDRSSADARYMQITGATMTGALTLSGDPTNALHAATKQYVDNAIQGLDAKQSVVVATTGNITLSGTQTIDAIAVVANDRVLVKNQTSTSENGVYVASAGSWTRATDMDAWTEFLGAFVFVEKGATNADTGWVCTVDSGGTLGSTAVVWSQFSGAGTYTASNGITKSGNDFQLTGQALALHNLATSGVIVRTGAGTVTGRTISTSGSGVTVTNGDGVSGNPVVSLSTGLSNLSALSWSAGTQVPVLTAANTWSLSTVGQSTGNLLDKAAGDALYLPLAGGTTGALTISTSTAQGLSLKGSTADHTYMGFYARSATQTTRSGYLGYASAATNTLTLHNEISNGDLELKITGTGSVLVPAGSQADPGIAFTNETNTGIFRHTANAIGYSFSGTVGFIMNSTVGFYSASGSGALLGHDTNTTTPSLIPYRSGTGATTGVGAPSGGIMNLIATGTEVLRVANTGMTAYKPMTFTPGTAGAGAEWLTFTPIDYTTGKPRFYIQKNATATKWDIGVSDGSINGQIDIQATSFTRQNNVVWDAGNSGTNGSNIIGYTPANKAGDTFTGTTVWDFGSGGRLRLAGSTGKAYIQAGDPTGDDTGGKMVLSGYLATNLDTLEILATSTTINGSAVYTAGNVGTNGASLIGYTPANKAGDTFSGAVTVTTSAASPIVLNRTGSSTNVNLSFAHTAATRYLGLNGNGELMFGSDNDLHTNGSKVWSETSNAVVTAMATVRAGFNITGGGTVAFDSSANLSWSARLLIVSVGNGSKFGTSGYFDITQPTNGTSITGVGGASNRTWSASGVLLNDYEALYYILPIGSGSASVSANFRVVYYNSAFEVPNDWLMIAVRSGDSDQVRFCTGITIDTNQSIDTTAYTNAFVKNADMLDGLHSTSFALLSGAAFTANVTTTATFQSTSTSTPFVMQSAPSGSTESNFMMTNAGGIARWTIGIASDANNNYLAIKRYTGTGINQDTPISISNTDGGVSLKLATGSWFTSADGVGRLNFTSSGRSYYKSGDGTHEWRNSSDAARMNLDASGNLSTVAGLTTGAKITASVGTATTSAEYLQLRPTDYASGKPYFYIQKSSTATDWAMGLYDGVGSTGNIAVAATQVTFSGTISATSDARLKEDIRDLDAPLDLALRMRPVWFSMQGREHMGFIAQEMRAIAPQVVVENAEGMLSIAYQNLTAVAIGAVQGLHGMVVENTARIASLESRMAALEAIIYEGK